MADFSSCEGHSKKRVRDNPSREALFMAKQRMLQFVTVGKEMPEKRPAPLRAHDFHEIYREFAAEKAAKAEAAAAAQGRWQRPRSQVSR